MECLFCICAHSFLSFYLQAVKIPGKLILQIAGAMHFANKEAIRQKILKRLKKEEVPLAIHKDEVSGIILHHYKSE